MHFMSTAISIISNKCSSSQHACDKDLVVCFPVVWDKRFEGLKTPCIFTATALPEFTSNLKILVRAKTWNKGHPVPMYLKSHSDSGQPGGHAPQVKLKDPAASGSNYRCRPGSSVRPLLYLLSDSSYTHEGGSSACCTSAQAQLPQPSDAWQKSKRKSRFWGML